MVHNNFGMEYFLFYLLAKIIRHSPDKRTLRQIGNLGCRDKRVKLRVDGSGNILTVDGNGLTLLEHLAEAFRKCLCGFSDHLPAEYISYRVLNNLGLLFTIIAGQLAEILKTQKYAHLVASCRCNQIVKPPEINGGKLIDDYGTFELSFLVDKFDNTGII